MSVLATFESFMVFLTKYQWVFVFVFFLSVWFCNPGFTRIKVIKDLPQKKSRVSF